MTRATGSPQLMSSGVVIQPKSKMGSVASAIPACVPTPTRRQIAIGLIAAPFILKSAIARSQTTGPARIINMHNASPWVARNYAARQRVISGGNAYECVVGGVSTTAPAGTGTTIQDGSMAWKYLSGVDYTDIVSMLAFFYKMTLTPNKPSWKQPIEVHFWNDREWAWTNSGYDEHKLGHSQDKGGYPLGSTAACPLLITAAPGESFRNNPNVRSNALNYNPAHGAAIDGTVAGGNAGALCFIHLDKDFVTVRGLQFRGGIVGDQTSYNFVIEDCILAGNCWIISGDYSVRNCLIAGWVVTSYGISCENCTILGGPGSIYLQYPAGRKSFENCLIYGMGAGPMCNKQGTPQISASHCQTDLLSPPPGFITAGTAASQFVNPANDFRLKAGAPAIGAAAAIASVGATDISGRTRPPGGRWDIGCWQT